MSFGSGKKGGTEISPHDGRMSDTEELLLLDIHVLLNNQCVFSTKHFMADSSESFSDTIKSVLTEYAEAKANDVTISDDMEEGDHPVKAEVRGMMGRIKSVHCVASPLMNLLKFAQGSSTFPTRRLNSKSCPIIANGLNIHLSPETEKDAGNQEKDLPSATDRLMGNSEPEDVMFLKWEEVPKPDFGDQIRKELYHRLESIEVGYFNISQRECLKKNIYQLSNVLCFVEKHWRKIINADFPTIPAGKCSDSMLLEVVSNCKRAYRSDGRLLLDVIGTHCGTLAGMSWLPFKRAKKLKKPLESFQNEIALLYQILLEKKKKMSNRVASIFNVGRPKRSSIPSAFEAVVGAVEVSNSEFYVPIEASIGKEKSGHSKTRMEACRDIAKEKLTAKLKLSGDYVPFFLSDEQMGITEEALYRSYSSASPADRALHRFTFRKLLSEGLEGCHVNIFGKLCQGMNNPSCLYIWKCPMYHGAEHIGKVQAVIQSCRSSMPKDMSKESAKHFNHIMRHISSISVPVRKALKNYLFLGDTNPRGDIAEEYCKFVLEVAAGNPIDESFVMDGRLFNSRGGRGIGHTQFDVFYEECRRIIIPTSTTEERRHSDSMFASEVLSIKNLIKRATDNLKTKVEAGELTEMPPIPSPEWVRMQFCPNNKFVANAGKVHGNLRVKRAVQSRTLRKEHEDQHFVLAMTRYILEWLIELRDKKVAAEFFGGDDKAKIAVGDKVVSFFCMKSKRVLDMTMTNNHMPLPL